MARTINIGKFFGREPRPGELNYELRRILLKHCTKQPLKKAIKSVQLAVTRLANQYGFNEFECNYDRTASLKHTKPWITEGLEVVIFRRKSNGTLSIYRAGATSYPHFYRKDGKGYANLSAPRDMSIFSTVDEPYTWERYYGTPSKIPARILKRKNAYKKDR